MALNNTADSIFYGGDIVTMDDEHSTAEALAIKDGKILAVGKQNHVFLHGGVTTKYICLDRHQTLLPGFIEAHTHAVGMAHCRCFHVNCSGFYCQSYEQIKELFKKTIAIARVDQENCKWCVFEGWDPELIEDLPDLNWDILDEFSRDVPILVLAQNMHAAWANRKAFDAAGITEDTKDPGGGYFVRDPDTQKHTGKMMEPPTFQMLLKGKFKPTHKEMSKAVDDQWEEYSRCGFTTITDLLYINSKLSSIIEEKSMQADCPLRLALYYSVEGLRRDNVQEPPSKMKKKAKVFLEENDKLWFQGVKIITDGSPHCGTIATRDPFLENDMTEKLGFPPSPCYGVMNYSDEELLEMVKEWHAKGKQIAVHAHGERAIDQVLSVYEKVLGDTDEEDRRHRIEHLGLADENHIIRASKLDLALSFFVAHLYFYGKVYSKSIFGEERTNRWAPLSLATKHGLRWTIHQDHPAFPGRPEPFANIKTAVTRTLRGDPNTVYGKEYCVTIEEALKAYTINAAWQIHKEKELGSLTVGKRADLVVLSDNPLKMDPFKLLDIKVLDTYLDGRSNGLSERKESRSGKKIVLSYSRYRLGQQQSNL